MNKQLNFTYKDKEYCLEFTRKSVEQMERNGFNASEITEKPMSTLPALFRGAFIANHPFEKPRVIDEIYTHMTDKSMLIGKLAEKYKEPIEAIVADPDEDDEGNVTWTASW